MAISLNQNHHKAYNGLAKLLLEHNQIDQAIDCFKKVVELSPYDHEAYTKLGDCFKKKEKRN